MHRKLHFQNDHFWPILAIFVKITPKILPWEQKFAPGGATGGRARAFWAMAVFVFPVKFVVILVKTPETSGGPLRDSKTSQKMTIFKVIWW